METILIIEDERELMEEISDLLKYEGYTTLQAQSGIDGIKMSSISEPDLVLCDIRMTPVDGFEVLARIREKPETSMIPFIFMTALSEHSSFRKGMELGADDYLIKPFSREELLKTIQIRINRRNMMKSKINQLQRNIVLAIPHEMKTPLNAILGFSKIINEYAHTQTVEDITEMARFIYESGNKLHKLINKYLVFVDIEIHKESISLAPLDDVPCFFKKHASIIAQEYNRLNDFKFECSESSSILIHIDWFRLAVTELIDNAFKFSGPGTPVLIRLALANDRMKLTIQDAGKGISNENMKMIDAFMQFERQKYAQQGVGLGLFLAKRIIEIHQGSFFISSQPDKGTTVCVSLPCFRITPQKEYFPYMESEE